MSSEPRNFREGDTWRPIDTDLQEAPDGSLRAGDVDGAIEIPDSLGSPVELEHGGRAVSFRLKGAAADGPETEGSEATFRGVFDGVDARYAATPTGVKETLVLSDESAPSVFKYDVRANQGWTAAERAGAIVLQDAQGAERYRVTAPLAWDSANDPAFTNKLELSVERVADGRWTVTLRPDSEWLRDPSRRFPVSIDPDFAWADGATRFHGATDTYLASGDQANSVFSSASYLQTGHYNRVYKALMKFDIAAAIPANAVVSSAKVMAYAPPATPKSLAGHSLRTVTSDWDANATWNRRKVGVPWSSAGGDVSTNPVFTSAPTAVKLNPSWYSWAAPLATVQGWVNGSLPNYGFQLSADANAPSGNAYVWASTETSSSSSFPATSAEWPSLEVTWNDPAIGAGAQDELVSFPVEPPIVESDGTTFEGDTDDPLGLNDVNINVVTGNLLLRQIDGVTEGELQARYYNSFSTETSGIGKGWRLEKSRAVRLESANNGNVKFTSPNGAVHTFVPDGNGKYRSPASAPGATLSVGANGAAEVATDDDDKTYSFPTLSSAANRISGGDRAAAELLADGSGLQEADGSHFTYDRSAGQITRISGPGGDAQYSYSGQLLAKYQDAHGSAEYRYDSASRLTEIEQNSWRFVFEYTASGRIQTAKRVSPTGEATVYTFSYAPTATTMTTGGVATVFTLSNGLVTEIAQPSAPEITTGGSLATGNGSAITTGDYSVTVNATSPHGVNRVGLWEGPSTWIKGQQSPCSPQCPASLSTNSSVHTDELPENYAKLRLGAVGGNGRVRVKLLYMATPTDTEPDGTEPIEPELTANERAQKAEETRGALGFDDSASTIAAAEASPAAREAELRYGVPLSPTEVDAMRLREELQDEMGDLDAASRGTLATDYAGMYFAEDATGGEVRVGFTNDVAGNVESVRSGSSRPTRIVGFQADYSLAALETLEANVNNRAPALQASGIEIIGTSVDVEHNRVEVQVAELTSSISTTLLEQFGQGIQLKDGEVLEGEASAGYKTPRRRNTPTKRKFAGQFIKAAPWALTHLPPGKGECTLAFSMTGDPTNTSFSVLGYTITPAKFLRYSTTAGHCTYGAQSEELFVNQGGRPYAAVWTSHFPSNDREHPTSIDASLLLPFNQKAHTTKVWVAPGESRRVSKYRYKSENTRGQQVCFLERKFDLTCGKVLDYAPLARVDFDIVLRSSYVRNMRIINRRCQPGTSGSPVFSYRPDGTVRAEGIVSYETRTGKCGFTNIDHIQDLLGDEANIDDLVVASNPIVPTRLKPKVPKLPLEVGMPEPIARPFLEGCRSVADPCSVNVGQWSGSPSFGFKGSLCGNAATCSGATPSATIAWTSRSAGGCIVRTAVVSLVASNNAGSVYVPMEGPESTDCAPTGTPAPSTPPSLVRDPSSSSNEWMIEWGSWSQGTTLQAAPGECGSLTQCQDDFGITDSPYTWDWVVTAPGSDDCWRRYRVATVIATNSHGTSFWPVFSESVRECPPQ